MAVETVLRALRVEKGENQETVANAVGMSVSGYQQVETAFKAVNAEKAQAIADYFGVPREAIFVPKYFTASQVEAV